MAALLHSASQMAQYPQGGHYIFILCHFSPRLCREPKNMATLLHSAPQMAQ